MNDKVRILVADDDKELVQTIEEELIIEGYEVVIAHDGEEALKAIQSTPFQIAILDLKMPKITGLEILQKVKKEFPAMKTIILTAYANLENVKKCRDLGADEVVEKPYDLGELFTAIEYFVGKKQG
jgi:DNA-binding response OmpR family regulator